MSENPEKEFDLEKIGLWDINDLKKAIKQSLLDYDGEICYMDGKTLKIRDFIDPIEVAYRIENIIRSDYLKTLTCSLKKPTTTS